MIWLKNCSFDIEQQSLTKMTGLLCTIDCLYMLFFIRQSLLIYQIWGTQIHQWFIHVIWSVSYEFRDELWCFNTTFSNISVISWRSVLLVEETVLLVKETGVPRENNRPAISRCEALSHNVVSSTPCYEWDS